MSELTIKSYLDNPMGKGVPIAGDLSVIKSNYLEQEEMIYITITNKWYEMKDKSLIAHVKIPSASKKNSNFLVYYDVLLEFDITNCDKKVTISELPMRVYSNSPSFVFTYANVFYHKDYLCMWAKSKYNKEVFKSEPSQRNTYRLVGFEKSLYTACLYISKHDEMIISKIREKAIIQKNYTDILKDTQSQDEVMKKYREMSQSGGMVQVADKKSGKTVAEVAKKKFRTKSNPTGNTKVISKIPAAIKAKKIVHTRKSKKI